MFVEVEVLGLKSESLDVKRRLQVEVLKSLECVEKGNVRSRRRVCRLSRRGILELCGNLEIPPRTAMLAPFELCWAPGSKKNKTRAPTGPRA